MESVPSIFLGSWPAWPLKMGEENWIENLGYVMLMVRMMKIGY
jgi:hypothetical protein